MKDTFEIKFLDGWFSVFNVATGKLAHIGSPSEATAKVFLRHVQERETPAGKAEWLRVNTHRTNFTGD